MANTLTDAGTRSSVRDDVDIATATALFHGMSDPIRLSILLSLLDGERRVGELVELVGSSQSNVSNHLACLKGCGLVVDRPGPRRRVFYSIAHPELRDVLVAAEQLLARAGHDVRLCNHPAMTGIDTSGDGPSGAPSDG
ncbi:MAG: metalloregulator ArsR/SmtB family transcription factor [Actinomycetota bacterium]|nr:metalloregulator ArsR/SmtB family transcription factor [Actinomycetota bacterium]